jgi:hypothetical protein
MRLRWRIESDCHQQTGWSGSGILEGVNDAAPIITIYSASKPNTISLRTSFHGALSAVCSFSTVVDPEVRCRDRCSNHARQEAMTSWNYAFKESEL